MIERLRLALDANHLPLMKQDDEGSYVKYEDAKVALLGCLGTSVLVGGSMPTCVRHFLGNEVVDEWMRNRNTVAMVELEEQRRQR